MQALFFEKIAEHNRLHVGVKTFGRQNVNTSSTKKISVTKPISFSVDG